MEILKYDFDGVISESDVTKCCVCFGCYLRSVQIHGTRCSTQRHSNWFPIRIKIEFNSENRKCIEMSKIGRNDFLRGLPDVTNRYVSGEKQPMN